MLTGKGLFIHKIKRCEDGNPEQAASVAFDAGITHIIIKVLDGPWNYNQRPYYDHGRLLYADDILPPFIKAFKSRGIQVWGYQWIYLDEPVLEARRALERVKLMGLDGFIVDAEGDAKNKPKETAKYLSALAGINVPTGLSSYRYPSLHNELDWGAWMKGLDIMFPQVYWMGATNPAAQLARSLEEYKKLAERFKIELQYIPTGAAFYEHGWSATPSQAYEFLTAARGIGLPAANFWEFWYARSIPGMWEAISGFPWGAPEIPVGSVPVNEFVVSYVYPGMVEYWGYSGPKPVQDGLTFKMEDKEND